MDQDLLVSDRVAAGGHALNLLDAAGYQVSAAFWNRFVQTQDWRLVVVPQRYEGRDVKAELVKIGEILRKGGADLGLSDVKVMPADTALVRALARYARVSGLKTGRVNGTVSGGVYIEDAYIYRMAL